LFFVLSLFDTTISIMKTLLQTHIQSMNDILQEAYQRSDDPKQRVKIALAALANLTWLRTMEEGVLPQAVDVHIIEPEDGYVLP
jgi:hypothetical protein